MNDEKYLFELPPAKIVAEQEFKKRNPIWTECKAKLIERSLYYFVLITHNGTYIDGFAGPQETDKPEMWAAKLVIESRPRWLRKFHLFELADSSVDSLKNLRDSQPPRDKTKNEPRRTIEIHPGDFNENISGVLKTHPVGDKEASFCLLDQRTFECDWKSVRTIATHKGGGNKIEIFYFFPEGWIDRSIAALKIDKEERLKRWWGDASWQELVKISGAVRGQYVADRFRNELKYKYSYPFPIYEKPDEGGRVMYYMVHASDHDDASKLMSRAYAKALDIKESPEQVDWILSNWKADSANAR
jgi:three-Cys-motif partner protein